MAGTAQPAKWAAEGEVLADLIQNKGFERKEFAQLLGVSDDVLSHIVRGVTRLHGERRKRAAAILNMDEAELRRKMLNGKQAQAVPLMVREPLKLIPTTPQATGMVKIYGPISAGGGNVAQVDWSEIEVPIEFSRQDYGGLVVDGDSMMPFLHHGDVCIFKDWQQVKPNHIVAAALPDGSWVVKKAIYRGDRFILESLNPTYDPIESSFKIAGFLVGFVRDDGPERLIRLNPYGLRD